MSECRIVVEFRESTETAPYMRWERSSNAEGADAFSLLGRAFDVSRRECKNDFHEALAAFLRGAMIQKEDLTDLIARLDDKGQVKP